jgi:hypothetical protein
MSLRTKVAAFWLATICVACGSAAPNQPGSDVISKPTVSPGKKAVPVIASSEVLVGQNRFLVGLLNRNGAPIGTPHTQMKIAFFDPKRSSNRPVSTIDTRFIWGLKPAIGFYEGHARFNHSGTWEAAMTLTGGGFHETDRQSFTVLTHGTTPAVGQRVPASNSPTGSGKQLVRITTDPHPNPRFYSTSIAQAVRAHKPFVVVFSTPKYCATELCGPMLDIAKQVSTRFPKMTFIQVEIYQLPRSGKLPADPTSLLQSVAVREWGLRSDPWTFVVNAHGRVAAKFEGTMTAGELRTAINRLLR